jgi:preprotein translocase subunit SecF
MNIIKARKLWFAFSSILIAIGIFSFISNFLFRGKIMNFGIDFTGGTILTLRFDQSAKIAQHLDKVRRVLEKFHLRENVIQKVGDNDLTIKTEPLESNIRGQILDELKNKFGNIELLEADTIGPVIGKELRSQAFWALLIATIGILIYVSFRFEFRYAVAAILALWHDALITIGLIAFLWRSVDSPFIAAILTILGYSINDTIIIFDRIRENIQRPQKGKIDFEETVNNSILQTMARSINTVLTVLFMNLCLLLFGGTTLKDFALTLFIGFSLGAYSSIFIASPILVMLEKNFGVQKRRG